MIFTTREVTLCTAGPRPTYTAEASSVRIPPGTAMPLGVQLRAHTSGVLVGVFLAAGVDSTPDGDVAGWRYRGEVLGVEHDFLIIND